MSASTTSHDTWLREQLAHDDEFMVAYLQAALEDCESSEEILLALRSAIEARGISAIADKVGMARESLSRALSPSGNPKFKTLYSLLQALGARFSVSPIIMKEVAEESRQEQTIQSMRIASSLQATPGVTSPAQSSAPQSCGGVTFVFISGGLFKTGAAGTSSSLVPAQSGVSR